jgi:PAS domain S-box-containing protein
MTQKPTYEELEQRIRSLEKDAAARQQAEEVLRDSEEKYKRLIESSLFGIFIQQGGRYVFVNDRFAQIHGYTPEELLGKESLTLIHPDDREALRQIAQKSLNGSAVSQRYVVHRLRKDGTTICCEMMATRIEYRGRPAIMGNVIDNTKRKRADKGLWESEKRLYQEEMRMEILKFANDVALELMHELRTPLVCIGGFSRRISTRDYPQDKLKEHTRIIFEESIRLDNVLNKVLAHLKAAVQQL